MYKKRRNTNLAYNKQHKVHRLWRGSRKERGTRGVSAVAQQWRRVRIQPPMAPTGREKTAQIMKGGKLQAIMRGKIK